MKEELIKRSTTKKFVFQINAENVDFIETLAYQDKQDLINDLILRYRNNEQYNNKFEEESMWLKKFIIFGLFVIIGIPALLLFLSYSFNLTRNSYVYMQKNFEKVYPKDPNTKKSQEMRIIY